MHCTYTYGIIIQRDERSAYKRVKRTAYLVHGQVKQHKYSVSIWYKSGFLKYATRTTGNLLHSEP